jgi:hypothetical protein
MDYLRLTIAVCLPWLGGYLWLAFLESRCRDHRPHPLRQVGYGLFIGYAGLQGIVLATDGANGAVEFWRIASVLTLLTAAGGLLLLRARLLTSATIPPAADRYSDNPRFVRILFWLLLCWATLHLVFAAIEILHRPVFPWDAWLNWIYRAKAWYFNSAILPMDNPQDWLLGTGTARYNVPGNNYPTFVPVLALWCASALGYWSETLVNLPVLLCGIALGLGMYGQCREFGLPKWQAALATYLLLSVPLVGVHLALAGMADIWMVGFTGLGFVALLHGLILARRHQMALGMFMVVMGIATKTEGTAWLLTALVLLALSVRTRISLLMLAVAFCLIFILWLASSYSAQIPILDYFGMSDGPIKHLMLDTQTEEISSLWSYYLKNYFMSGSWHLLWIYLLIVACSLFLLPAGIGRRSLVVFYCITLAALFFSLAFGEKLDFGENWRIPGPPAILHIVPAIIYSILIAWNAISVQVGHSFGKEKLIIRMSITGLLVSVSAAIAYVYTILPAGENSLTELASNLFQMLKNWNAIEFFSQESVKSPRNAYSNSFLTLPFLISTWTIVSALLIFFLRRRMPETHTAALIYATFGWLALDITWTANSLAQSAKTIQSYPFVKATHWTTSQDENIYRFIRLCGEKLNTPYKRTVITAVKKGSVFHPSRAKYHALPASAYAEQRVTPEIAARIGDYLLVLRDPSDDKGASLNISDKAISFDQKKQTVFSKILDQPEGMLFAIEP